MKNAIALNRVHIVFFSVVLLITPSMNGWAAPVKKPAAAQKSVPAAPTKKPPVKQSTGDALAQSNVLPFVMIGSHGGVFAGFTTLASELTMVNILKNQHLGWRGAFKFSTGVDSFSVRRSHYALSLDLLYRKNGARLGKGWFLSGGPNVILTTTGQRVGSVGYQIGAGYEWNAKTYRAYFELGYGTLRTGFSPDNQGVSVLVGMNAK